ncbi:MAG: serine--tRNA ligase [Vulcanibacillus sp.]
MLDIKILRNNLDMVKKALEHRNEKINEIDTFTDLDIKRRELLKEVEQLKNQRNNVSNEVAELKKTGKNAEDLIKEMREVGDKIKEFDDNIRELDSQLNDLMLRIPNIPHESVPVGISENDNIIIRSMGIKPNFEFKPKPHFEIAENLGILDFESATKVAGSRFVFYKGIGARLERALINFMLDLHVEKHGYEEILPPFIVNRSSMIGTGQLPKFEEDAFKIQGMDLFLIPTAEVPVTNIHRDEILDVKDLPKCYAAFSACFRSEAGSAGRDTRGLIRQHQFNKVELVKFVKPEDSYKELEKLREDAERVLQLLNLPYQVLNMCTADLGFTAAKKYDLEVWLPSFDNYREISSISNFESFQAMRANIKFRRGKNERPEYVHTLNGSGLAVGRTVAAIIENYQQKDGSVIIPEALKEYMHGIEVITKK